MNWPVKGKMYEIDLSPPKPEYITVIRLEDLDEFNERCNEVIIEMYQKAQREREQT